MRQRGVVNEGRFFGVGFQEEVEGIDDRHFGDQIDLHQKLAGLFREYKAREIIGLRVLLPIQEMLLGRDLQGIAEDRRAAMRRGAQADNLRRQIDQLVVGVMRAVGERDLDGHCCFCLCPRR